MDTVIRVCYMNKEREDSSRFFNETRQLWQAGSWHWDRYNMSWHDPDCEGCYAEALI